MHHELKAKILFTVFIFVALLLVVLSHLATWKIFLALQRRGKLFSPYEITAIVIGEIITVLVCAWLGMCAAEPWINS